DAVAVEVELAGRLEPLDRGWAGGHFVSLGGRHLLGSGWSDQDQRCVPGPNRYWGSVSGPQLAVPRPRCAASSWTTVSARGLSSTSWVAEARSSARKWVAETWRGSSRPIRSPRPASSDSSSQRTSAWPPFSR